MERRLAAVVMADVVGYSRLMEEDEAGTLARLKEQRASILEPTVAAHGGRIVKLMGDGVLIEFGSAVNAVAGALELQRRMTEANGLLPASRRIVLRIGINLGDVIGEGADIYGEGVNIAARLQALAEPGGISLSEKVYTEVRGKIGVKFEDLGQQSLRNMDWPVRVLRIRSGEETPAIQPATTLRDKPSIAVLAFQNMSGDPEQEYFVDGISEDIITELSRFRNLTVIARNSSFHYKGRAPRVQDVGRELGARYIVEGSVRKAGDRVRITAQLIDSETGAHLWANKYDRKLEDIFAVQDEITQDVVGLLAVAIEDQTLDLAKRKRPESVRAYEHWLRGKRFLWTSGATNLEARRHFERAIAVDPNFSWAHAGLSLTYQMEAQDYPSEPEFLRLQKTAHEYAERALALDEGTYQAHVALAWTHLYRKDYDRSKHHLDRAIALNPNDADSLANASWIYAMLGHAERGVMTGETALRLNPRHPDWYLAYLSTALFASRRYSEAIAHRLKVPDLYVDSPFYTAAMLTRLGRIEEARHWASLAVKRLAASPRGVTAAQRGCVQVVLDNSPFRLQADRDHFAESMREAGVPG